MPMMERALHTAFVLFLACGMLHAQPQRGQQLLISQKIAAAGGTWTVVQKVFVNGCANALTCTTGVITATTAGNAGVILATVGVATHFISSVTGGIGTVPAGCQASDASAGIAGSCAYGSLTGGSVAIVVTWDTATPGAAAAGTGFEFLELNWSGASWAIDAGASAGLGAADISSAVNNPAGPNLTLAGTSDAIFQLWGSGSGHATAIGSSYTLDSNGAQDFMSFGHILNSSSGTGPTWTNSTTIRGVVGALALSGN